MTKTILFLASFITFSTVYATTSEKPSPYE